MAKVEIEFKFKVGDMVLPKAAADYLQREKDAGENAALTFGEEGEVRWIVKEIIYQQCYNTFQIHYDCFAVNKRGHMTYNKYQRFTEFEIEYAPTFEVKLRKKKDGPHD